MNDFFSKTKRAAKTLLLNRLFHLALLVTGVFTFAEVTVGDGAVRVAAESSRIAVYAVLACVTFTAAAASFWRGARSGGEQMAVALFGISMAIFIHAMWVPVSRYTEWPGWFDPSIVTSALIIAIALSGLGYLIPISIHRNANLPVVGSWAGVFAAGMLAGGLMGIVFATGITVF